MTTTRKVLIPTQAAPTAVAALYTAPVGTRAVLDAITATNTTGSAITVTAHLVPASASPAAGNVLAQAISIAAGASYLFPELRGHDLEPGGAIAMVASAAGLVVRASGREMTTA